MSWLTRTPRSPRTSDRSRRNGTRQPRARPPPHLPPAGRSPPSGARPPAGGRGGRAPPPLPEHGAQLVVLGEADAMIAAEQLAVAVRQEMADLAVGVVHHGIEDGHVPQCRMVIAAGERDDIHRLVRLDPQLAHAAPQPAVPAYARR